MWILTIILVFVTKDKQNSTYTENEKNTTCVLNNANNVYKVTGVNLNNNSVISDLAISSEKQIMVQFLYRKKQSNSDRLLVFLHLQSKCSIIFELILKYIPKIIKTYDFLYSNFLIRINFR